MKTSITLILTCLLGLVFLGTAAEPPGGGPPPAGAKPGIPSTWMQEWAKNNPKRYEELMKLRRENAETYQKKVREIYEAERNLPAPATWPKYGSEPATRPADGPPRTNETENAGKAGERAWSKPREPAPPAGETATGAGTPRPDALAQAGGLLGERPRLTEHLIKKWREENPERYDKLMALRDQNPQAFHEEVRKLVEEKRLEFVSRNFGGADGKVEDLIKQYRASNNPQERDQIKAQLREQLARTFDSRLDKQGEHLQELEKQLNELRQQIAARKAQREAILQQHLDGVLQGDAPAAPTDAPTATSGAGAK